MLYNEWNIFFCTFLSEFIANISGKRNEEKISFIKEVLELSESDRMASFQPTLRSRFSPDEISRLFFNQEKELRDWILIKKNQFYCVYCCCFSRSEDEISTCGVDFTQKGARLLQKWTRHENTGTHALAKDIYRSLLTDPSHENPLRESVECIIKSILFLATHGTKTHYLLKSCIWKLVRTFRINFSGLGYHGNPKQNLSCFSLDKDKNYFKCQNEGNFLGLLKLLSGENENLRSHLIKCKQHENRNNIHGPRGRPSFLTHEFISQVLQETRSIIISTICRNQDINCNL